MLQASIPSGDGAQYCRQLGLSIKLPLIFFVKHLVSSTAEIPMIGEDGGKMRTADFLPIRVE
jgi:hypothetical protein